MNGFEYLRSEGRKEVLKALEPYIEHTLDCLLDRTEQAARKSVKTGEHKVSIHQFKCICGLDEILERIRFSL